MNAATFRALRETCGLSRRAVAETLGVTEKAVQYWERGLRPVPEHVADWVTAQVATHDEAVRVSVEAYEDMAERHGEPEGAWVAYYRTQHDYDLHGRDPGEYSVVNARSRAIASEFRAMGVDVEFRYPGEDEFFPYGPRDDG